MEDIVVPKEQVFTLKGNESGAKSGLYYNNGKIYELKWVELDNNKMNINLTYAKPDPDVVPFADELNILVSPPFDSPRSEGGGRSVRKSSKKSAKKTVKKECPVKTSRTHKGKDGVVRRLYKRGVDFFVKVKSSITGKFVYKKVKA
jgi:hypothetical protein